jgi:hypothetical protein
MYDDVRGRAADVWGLRGREFKSRHPDKPNTLSAQVRMLLSRPFEPRLSV